MNKRSTIVLLLPLLHLTGMTALAAPPLELGVQGGLSLATASSDGFDFPGSPGLSSRTGFALGAYATIRLTNMLYLQPEVQYVQRGAMLEGLAVTSPQRPEPEVADVTFMYDYLTFPILLKGQMELGALSPFLFLGPEVAFRISAETHVNYSVSDPHTFSTEDDISNIDYAFNFGAGVAYHITPVVSISMNGRYNLGLKDIRELMGPSWKSRGWQVLVAIGVVV